jgi:hypothetical protein
MCPLCLQVNLKTKHMIVICSKSERDILTIKSCDLNSHAQSTLPSANKETINPAQLQQNQNHFAVILI